MNIYVGNLAWQMTEDELYDLFAAHGEVTRATIISDRDTGRSKGFGFVEMTNDEEGKAAIESLNGQELKGRNLTVNEARPRAPRGPGGPRSGGGGGRNGGGGGGGGGRGGFGGPRGGGRGGRF